MKTYRFLKRPRTKPLIMLETVAIFLAFLLLLQGRLWYGTALHEPRGTVNYIESGWTLRGPEGTVSSSAENGQPMELQSGVLYEMSLPLTYDGRQDPNPYGFPHVDHMYCRVLLDGEELVRFQPEDVKKWDRSSSPGFFYHTFPLPEDVRGRTLTLELLPSMPGVRTFNLPELLLGDYRSMLRNFLTADVFNVVVTVLCMMLGISALLFSAASFTGSDYREGFNIGAFSLLVSLYFYTECRINFFILANPYYLYLVSSLAVSLLPVSFMGVMRECMPGIQKRICTGVIVAEMGFFLAEMFCHFTGRIDMGVFYFAIHLISLSEMVINTLLLLSLRDQKIRRRLAHRLAPVLVGMALDAVLYMLDGSSSQGSFTIIGVLVFLLLQLVHKLVSQAGKMDAMQQYTIEGMATLIESRDGSTGAHVRNTGVYARMIAREMYRRRMYPRELTSEFVDRIGRIAPLHDVGKIKISDTILNKPGKFTPEEYEIMKTHAPLGGEIITQILSKGLEPEMLQMAQDVATYHHERWDGTGYPSGKKGTEIPLCARIMAVADVFDALSSRRVYKPEMSIDQVFGEMERNAGTQFQKELVEVVVSLRPQLEAYLEKIKTNQPVQEERK